MRARPLVAAMTLAAAAFTGAAITGVVQAHAASAVVATDATLAARYGHAHGLRVGVAVLDLHTGAYYGGGVDTGYF